MRWFEIVPNISIAGKPEMIKDIQQMFRRYRHCFLMHHEGGSSANRTVLSILAEEKSVVPLGLELAKIAEKYINMEAQKGVHPRMGALDVFPIIPVKGEMSRAVSLAHEFGKALAEEMKIPGYYYEMAALAQKNQNLANARCSYEKLAARVQKEPFDFGIGLEYEKSGATAVGARPLMLAVNFSLEKADLKTAKRIAEKIRESGNRKEKGMYLGLKSIAWYLEDLDKVQISCNVTRMNHCHLFDLFHTIDAALNLKKNQVSGTEIIGLVPESALLNKNLYPGTKEEKLNFAVQHLRLSELQAFKIEERVLEQQVEKYIGKSLEWETQVF